MMNSGFEELLGIDRGLRSSASASLQEDALRRAVTLYEKYGEREEILQALLLRLIDYFRICPLDARRIQLVDVLEQDIAKYKEEDETGHWQPIRVRGVGELARRLITQWESNDVLTRSLVVRLFRLFDFDFDGEKASHLCCSPTAASVYYRIAQSLQSRSPEEHLEALHTSISLARRAAPSFALYIVDAALDLLQDQYTLPAVQQSLLRLLYFAISDATAAAQIFTVVAGLPHIHQNNYEDALTLLTDCAIHNDFLFTKCREYLLKIPKKDSSLHLDRLYKAYVYDPDTLNHLDDFII